MSVSKLIEKTCFFCRHYEVRAQTDLSYVKEKIKDNRVCFINPKQMELFESKEN